MLVDNKRWMKPSKCLQETFADCCSGNCAWCWTNSVRPV